MEKIICCVLLTWLVMGCESTFRQSDCQDANWYEVGYQDAFDGEVFADFSRYSSMCSSQDIVPDREGYQDGYVAGVNDYCTKENGYKRGSKGGQYARSCPPKSPYYEAYIAGVEDYKEKADRRAVENITRPSPDVTDRTSQAQRVALP